MSNVLYWIKTHAGNVPANGSSVLCKVLIDGEIHKTVLAYLDNDWVKDNGVSEIYGNKGFGDPIDEAYVVLEWADVDFIDQEAP